MREASPDAFSNRVNICCHWEINHVSPQCDQMFIGIMSDTSVDGIAPIPVIT